MKHFLLASLMLGFASMGYANTVNNTNTFVKKHTRVLSEEERFTVNNFTLQYKTQKIVPYRLQNTREQPIKK